MFKENNKEENYACLIEVITCRRVIPLDLWIIKVNRMDHYYVTNDSDSFYLRVSY